MKDQLQFIFYTINIRYDKTINNKNNNTHMSVFIMPKSRF